MKARLGLLILVVTAWLPMGLPVRAEEAFEKAVRSTKADLEASLKKLADVRKEIADQKIPMSKKLRSLENDLVSVREEFNKVDKVLTTRNLDVHGLNKDIKSRKNEEAYLSNLFDEYVRNFNSRLHVSEFKRYEKPLKEAESAPEDPYLSPAEKLKRQIQMVNLSLDRMVDLAGGSRFKGTAVDNADDGQVKAGTFVVLGPTVVFASEDGKSAGMAEQRIGSLEPMIVPIDFGPDVAMTEAMAGYIKEIAESGKGRLPVDPSLGNAEKIAETKDTVQNELQKGGVFIWPIMVLAGASVLVGVLKLIQLLLVMGQSVSRQKVNELLKLATTGRKAEAEAMVVKFRGLIGEMLKAAVQHLEEPKELIEEVMYERVLAAKLKLQSFIPFVTLSAAAAPLLGLLGTVSGMINTFKLIEVFGTGDAKSLSGGISEALLTTKWGLIVAIPALLLASLLTRFAKGIIDGMEKTAINFVNRIAKARGENEIEPSENTQMPVSPAWSKPNVSEEETKKEMPMPAPAMRPVAVTPRTAS